MRVESLRMSANLSSLLVNGKTVVFHPARLSCHCLFVTLGHLWQMPNMQTLQKEAIVRASLLPRENIVLRRNGRRKHCTLFISIIVKAFQKISAVIYWQKGVAGAPISTEVLQWTNKIWLIKYAVQYPLSNNSGVWFYNFTLSPNGPLKGV